MASLYAQYVKEREGLETIETRRGFITYKFIGNDCYINSLYVVPEARRTKEAWNLASEVEKIAKQAGKKALLSTVDANTYTATEALHAQMAYGFKIYRQEKNMIRLFKEI